MALVTTMATTTRQLANMTLEIVVQKLARVHNGTKDMNAARTDMHVSTPIARRKKLKSLLLATTMTTWVQHSY